MNKRCKHGMILETCAICNGLVKPIGETHYAWIDFCDKAFTNATKQSKNVTEENVWFSQHRQKLINEFTQLWGQVPPYPTWPER